MKLIYEHHEVKGEIVEDLNESTGKSTKSYFITGVFSTIGEKNRNGRIYPKHIWESEVTNYQRELDSNSINTLMEWEHPERTTVDPMQAIAKIVSLKIEGNKVVGRAKLLNNDKANQLKSLIDEGMSIGVSSRGVGSVGKDGMVEKFKLVTYDAVSSPSDYNGYTKGLTESIENGILMTEDFDIDENNNIVKVKVCGKKACMLANKDKVDEAILERFEEFFGKPLNESDDLLPIEVKKLSISQLVSILSKMTKGDKVLKVVDLINVLKHQEDTTEVMSNELFRKVYSERSFKTSEKEEVK